MLSIEAPRVACVISIILFYYYLYIYTEGNDQIYDFEADTSLIHKQSWAVTGYM